jgi:hypothetical protein
LTAGSSSKQPLFLHKYAESLRKACVWHDSAVLQASQMSNFPLAPMHFLNLIVPVATGVFSYEFSWGNKSSE